MALQLKSNIMHSAAPQEYGRETGRRPWRRGDRYDGKNPERIEPRHG
jgi:hypothetical protein